MPTIRQTLAEWIEEAFTDSDKPLPCTMLALVHMSGTFEEEVHAITLRDGEKRSSKELGETFQKKAEHYSQDSSGVETFQLQAFYNGESKPRAKRPFMVNGQALNEPKGMYTEGPTPQGRMMQGMRFDEMFGQQLFRRQEALDHYTLGYLDKVSKEAEHLRKNNMELFEIVKDATFKLADRRQEHIMKQLEFIRSSEEREVLMRFLPPLLNAASGRELFPQSLADTQLVEALAEKVSKETIAQLAANNVIDQRQAGVLIARIEKAEKDKKRRDAMRAQLLATDDELEMPVQAYTGGQKPEEKPAEPPALPEASSASVDPMVDTALLRIIGAKVTGNDLDMLVNLGKMDKETAEVLKARFAQLASENETTQQENAHG